LLKIRARLRVHLRLRLRAGMRGDNEKRDTNYTNKHKPRNLELVVESLSVNL